MALPKTAFVDPAGSNRTEIETLLHQAVALLVEVLAEAGNGSPLPTTLPIDQLERWAEIPRQSQDADLLLGEVRSHLLGHQLLCPSLAYKQRPISHARWLYCG